VNVVRKVLGHEQASTTLDIYTHTPDDYEQRVIDALSADAFLLPSAQDEAGEENEGDVRHML